MYSSLKDPTSNSIKFLQLFGFGLLSGLALAPLFLFPVIFVISILCWRVKQAKNLQNAAVCGFSFGLGYFLTSLYWIAIGVSVYIEDFWWFMPLVFFGLPLLLSPLVAIATALSWPFRSRQYYHLAFCLTWVFFEWLSSWVLTGFPWNLLAYSLSFSNIMIQSSSIISIYGLSLVIIYSASSFYSYFEKDFRQLKINLTTSIILFSILGAYGVVRLNQNPTELTNFKIKIIQPSVPQIAKWDPEYFWYNLESHVKMSISEPKADMIIWSESALTVPYNKFHPVHDIIKELQAKSEAILVTGSVAEELNQDQDILYSTMIALDKSANPILEYKKIHLIPFGEYIPLKQILSFKKITAGLIDYSPGKNKTVTIDSPKLSFRPLICYEAVFSEEARVSNKNIDAFINISNDAWYGRSSGPYQHFYITRFRAVENGLPLLRASNNGISAIIDPFGRILSSLPLNTIGQIDGLLPKKLTNETIYSKYGNRSIMLSIFLVLLIQLMVSHTFKSKKIN